MYTILEAITTANPAIRGTQQEAARFMQRIESLSPALKKRLPALYARSGIDFRYSCIEDFVRDPDQFDFFPKTWTLKPPPGTRKRNRKYRDEVVPLAEGVARDALKAAGIEPSDVTHLIAISCTGFFAPGLDIHLVKRLGLPAGTARTMIGFMGCYATFNGLRVAHAICQSHPDARVLLVSAELCTLHFQIEDHLESAIVNALFSDGAAAAVLSARSGEAAKGRLAYVDGACCLDEDSLEDMTWDVGDSGFLMGLSARVPAIIARHLPGYVAALLGRNGVSKKDLDFWAVHPGGRRVVEVARDVLGLSEEAVSDSFEVLRLYGNMSSPTILFILKRIMERREGPEKNRYRQGIALAFGPGLTIEGCLFRAV